MGGVRVALVLVETGRKGGGATRPCRQQKTNLACAFCGLHLTKCVYVEGRVEVGWGEGRVEVGWGEGRVEVGGGEGHLKNVTGRR